MFDYRLIRKIRNLYNSTQSTEGCNPEFQRNLEKQMLSTFRSQHPYNRKWLTMLNPWNRISRFAVIFLAVILTGAGVGSSTTTTSVEMGVQIVIELPFTEILDASGQQGTIAVEMAEWLRKYPGVEAVDRVSTKTVNNNDDIGPQKYLELAVWGEDLNPKQLKDDLKKRFDELTAQNLNTNTLDTVVTESWVKRLQGVIKDMKVDGSSSKEIRTEIIEQLREQGMEVKDVTVEFGENGERMHIMVDRVDNDDQSNED